tara:strand:+ start:555 stop:1514 length:960 start_codon:yes stop_codon:yes gene_type:complete
MKTKSLPIVFENNDLLSSLFGDHDRHLARIEQLLGVTVASRGNSLLVVGGSWEINIAKEAINGLYNRLLRGLDIGIPEVDAAISFARHGAHDNPESKPDPDFKMIKTYKKSISPRSPRQQKYMEVLDCNDLVFGLGPAGTGKTYLAVGKAVSQLMLGQVKKIILSRPAVEAGERLGFLPGDMKNKIDPYLRPLYDALYDMMPTEQVDRRLQTGEIEIAPLAFMRGRTLSNAFIILDEAQNATKVQMKMFLTRIGEHSRMVITGDLTQIDLPSGVTSGLKHAVKTLGGVQGVSVLRFYAEDVVRHRLVSQIVHAYEEEGK